MTDLRTSAAPAVRAARLAFATEPAVGAGLAALALVTAVLPNLLILAIADLLDALPDTVGRSDSAGELLRLVVPVAIVQVLLLLIEPAWTFAEAFARERYAYAFQVLLLEDCMRPPGIAHLDDPAVLDRVASTQESLSRYLPSEAPAALARVVGGRLAGIGACGLLATHSLWLGLVPVVTWLVARRPIVRAVREAGKAFGGEAATLRRSNYFRDLVTRPPAALEVRVFGIGGWAVDRFRAAWRSAVDVSWTHNRALMRSGLVGAVPILIGYGAVTIVIGRELVGDALDVRTGTIAILATLGSIAFGASPDEIPLTWALAALPEVDEVGRGVAAAPAVTGSGAAPDRFRAIEMDVSFAYPGAAPVLDGLSLRLDAGTSTAIVGVNGAGKTTLVKLLARLRDPSAGVITVDGIDLATLDPRAWQRRVAIVHQDFARLPLSLYENVALGAPEHRDDRAGVERVAGLAGLDEVVSELPAGWATLLTRDRAGGVDLSGGQWQRVALARALFGREHGADVLVLDEPTASLDVRAEAAFFERFTEMTEGVTTVLISHRFPTIRCASRIHVLAGGRITESGTHEQLMDLDGAYANAYRLQSEAFADGGVLDR